MFVPGSRDLDFTLLHKVQDIFSFFPIAWAKSICSFGGQFYLFWPQLVVVTTLFSHKKYWHGILLVIFTQFAWHFCDFIKDIIGRERPCGDEYAGFSFPSCHAFVTVTFYGLLIYLVSKFVKNRVLKYVLNTLFTIYILLVCLARMILTVHFPLDIYAGINLGLVLITIYSIIFKAYIKENA